MTNPLNFDEFVAILACLVPIASKGDLSKKRQE